MHLFLDFRLTVQKESIIKLLLILSEAKNNYGGFPTYPEAGERLRIRGMFNIPLDEADQQNEPEEIRSLSKKQLHKLIGIRQVPYESLPGQGASG